MQHYSYFRIKYLMAAALIVITIGTSPIFYAANADIMPPGGNLSSRTNDKIPLTLDREPESCEVSNLPTIPKIDPQTENVEDTSKKSWWKQIIDWVTSLINIPTAQASSKGDKIAKEAIKHLGNLNAKYYSPDTNNACASFVSTVLVTTGIIPQKTPSISRSLIPELEKAGAELVTNGINPNGKDGEEDITNLWNLLGNSKTPQIIQPGDIIIFAYYLDEEQKKRFGIPNEAKNSIPKTLLHPYHSMIYVGKEDLGWHYGVYASASKKRIVSDELLNHWGGRTVLVYRFND